MNYGMVEPFTPPSRRLPQATAGLAGALQQIRQQQEAYKLKKAIGDIYKQNTNPDGTMNRQAIYQGLLQINPEMAMKQQDQWTKQDKALSAMRMDDLKSREKRLDIGATRLKNVYDENTYRAYIDWMARDNPRFAQGLLTKLADTGFQQSDVDNLQRMQLSAKDKISVMKAEKNQLLGKEFRQWWVSPQIQDLVEKSKTDKTALTDLTNELMKTEYADLPAAKTALRSLKPSMFEELVKATVFKEDISQQKLTGEEKKQLGAVGGAVDDLNKIVDMYNEGLASGEAGTAGGAAAATGAELPFFGQRLFPDAAEFNKYKKITSEKFLRAATGAAAPATEVRTYMGFMPEWGDTPRQAQAAMDSFVANIKSKSSVAVSRLRAEGYNEKADKIEANLRSMLAQIRKIDLSLGKKEKPTTPTDADIDNMSPEELQDYLKAK